MSAIPIRNPRLRDKERRIRLEGEVADPSNPPSGCYFHPRCRYAQPICSATEPALRRLETPATDGVVTDHFAACHFAEELNLRGVIVQEKLTPS